MRLAVLVAVASLVAGAAGADEMEAPHIVLSQIDWPEAANSLPGHGADTPAAEFAHLNAQTGKRLRSIEKSSVPVLLPMDVDAFRKDVAAGAADAETSNKYFGPFHPSKLFLPGPAGYTTTFFLNPRDGGFDFKFAKPIEIEITGGAFVYDLDGPNVQETFPAKNLGARFPGIQRILRDNNVRYTFERFGVPYVVSVQCYDRPLSARYLSCREADPAAVKFLNSLHIAGGSPMNIAQPQIDLSRPTAQSDFTYYSPGNLISNTGWHKLPGRADYHVYARITSPMAEAPSYVKSQSFMPWGDCYRSGHTGRLGPKDAEYTCKVNGIPLTFNEAAAVNFTYPWRDNFCELRQFLVGQCPGGRGHQGEDIRPSNCVLREPAADRCLPYKHSVTAVRDGVIWRSPSNIGVYIEVNTQDDFVRFRYLHMNPKFMDSDGLLTGRQVREGQIIGKVGTWGDYEKGTSYHLHFNIQVFTKVGWVWVNPYMTLVAAYERQIGGRGTELKPGDPAPPVPTKPPVIAGRQIPMPPTSPVMRTRTSSAEPGPTAATPEPLARPVARTPVIVQAEPRPRLVHQERRRKRHVHKNRRWRHRG